MSAGSRWIPLALGCGALVAIVAWSVRSPDSPELRPVTPAATTEEQPIVLVPAEANEDPIRSSASEPAPPVDPAEFWTGVVLSEDGDLIEGAEVFLAAEEPFLLDVARSDAEGNFRFRRREASGSAFIYAEKDGYLRSARVQPGSDSEELQLVLTPAGVLRGILLTDAEIPPNLLRVRLGTKPAIAQVQPNRDPWEQEPASDGSFAFEGLTVKGETQTLEIKSAGVVLLRFDSFQVTTESDPPDPRLNPLDLRGMLDRISIEVRDDTGAVATGASVTLRDPRRQSPPRRRTVEDGRAIFIARAGGHEIEVEKAGFRRVVLSDVRGNQVVHLQSGLSVRAVLDGPAHLPPTPYGLVVALHRDDPPGPARIDGWGRFEAREEVSFRALSAGPHDVVWYLESGNHRHFLDGIPKQVVELADRDAEQVVRLSYGPPVRQAWEAKIAELEKEANRPK